MAQLQRLTIFDSGYLELPAGTTAQRPSSPISGMVRYNTTTKKPEFYNGNVWANMFAGPGGSPVNPAYSADEISAFNPDAENGYYWIKQVGGTAFQHFCVFKKVSGEPIEGGPWTVPLVTGINWGIFTNDGTTSITTFQTRCREIGIETPGRGMESTRAAADARGAWLATKIAIHQITNGNFVFEKSSGSGGVVAMPIMNINGEGGSSDHRIICNRSQSPTLPVNIDGDACNANQLICGWWGGTDIASWSRYDDAIPGPEDWGPANAVNTSYGGGGLSPGMLSCVYH
jgi:hypothetical protein